MTFARFGDELLPQYIEGKGLVAPAVALHFVCVLKCVSRVSDGTIDDASVAATATQLKIRQRRYVIEQLVDAGLWSDLGDGRYRIDWTHQKTADQVHRDAQNNVTRQADFRERDSRCKAGDHSLCAGTKRLCQRRRNGVAPDTPSYPVLSVPAREKDEDQVEELLPARPDGIRSGADAPPGPAGSPNVSGVDGVDGVDSAGRAEEGTALPDPAPRSQTAAPTPTHQTGAESPAAGQPEGSADTLNSWPVSDWNALLYVVDPPVSLAALQESASRVHAARGVMVAHFGNVLQAKKGRGDAVEIRLRGEYWKLTEQVTGGLIYAAGQIARYHLADELDNIPENQDEGGWPVRYPVPSQVRADLYVERATHALTTAAEVFVDQELAEIDAQLAELVADAEAAEV